MGERRMTEEIEEAGKKQMVEWTEQQNEIRAELSEALAAQKQEHDSWKAKVDVELQRARAESREVYDHEAHMEHRLSEAKEEMARQAHSLKMEVSEKNTELHKLSQDIEDLH